MSAKKRAEKYKILYSPLRDRLGLRWLRPDLHTYKYNVVLAPTPPINEYVPVAGFDKEAEAKAYRRWLVQAARKAATDDEQG